MLNGRFILLSLARKLIMKQSLQNANLTVYIYIYVETWTACFHRVKYKILLLKFVLCFLHFAGYRLCGSAIPPVVIQNTEDSKINEIVSWLHTLLF